MYTSVMPWSADDRALTVRIVDDKLCVTLTDGRVLSVPFERLQRLRDASPRDRSNFRLVGHGIGIHWPTLDEDLSIHGLIGMQT